MVQKLDKTPQLDMFKTLLQHFIHEKHELVLLAKAIDWDYIETQLGKYYCMDNGRPGVPIRTIS